MLGNSDHLFPALQPGYTHANLNTNKEGTVVIRYKS
jgi:hypothetical protein